MGELASKKLVLFWVNLCILSTFSSICTKITLFLHFHKLQNTNDKTATDQEMEIPPQRTVPVTACAAERNIKISYLGDISDVECVVRFCGCWQHGRPHAVVHGNGSRNKREKTLQYLWHKFSFLKEAPKLHLIDVLQWASGWLGQCQQAVGHNIITQSNTYPENIP